MRGYWPAFFMCVALIPGSLEAGGFVIQDGDLPEALVDEHRIAFTRNGALAVAREGRWIFDLGVSYATSDWSDWGTQIRRPDPMDSWSLSKDPEQVLGFDAILHNLERKKRFMVQQETRLLPHGLRLSYRVSPFFEQKLGGFGATVHIPIAETPDAHVEFWPGFKAVPLPPRHEKGLLETQAARAAILFANGEPRFALIAERMTEWSVYDDREWNNNTYRIIVRDKAVTEGLAAGNDARFSCDLALGQGCGARVPLAGFSGQADSYGRMSLSLGDAKVMEGGLASDATAAEWLHERSVPVATPLAADETTGLAALCTLVDREPPLHYSLQVEKRDEALMLEYAIEEVNIADERVLPVVAFAIPNSALVGDPVLSVAASSEATKDAREGGPGPLPYTAQLRVSGGAQIVLSAGRAWKIASNDVGGVACHILSVTGWEKGDEGARTHVLIGAVAPPGQQAGEESQ